MKRPRRPAKKIARKAVRKTAKKKAIKRRAKPEIPPQRKADPFWLAPHLIPAGWGYAWKVNTPGAVGAGWGLVPFSRHAHDFPRSFNNRGFIVHEGLILCEATADQIESERWSLLQDAKKQVADIRERFRMDADNEGRMVRIMPDSWVETEEIPRGAAVNEGPPVEVEISLTLRVPVRWRSAAQYLKLTLVEYTRRRILLERPVLGTMDPLGTEKLIYQPVQLSFTPVKES